MAAVAAEGGLAAAAAEGVFVPVPAVADGVFGDGTPAEGGAVVAVVVTSVGRVVFVVATLAVATSAVATLAVATSAVFVPASSVPVPVTTGVVGVATFLDGFFANADDVAGVTGASGARRRDRTDLFSGGESRSRAFRVAALTVAIAF